MNIEVNEIEANLLSEALYDLLGLKRIALNDANDCRPPGVRPFTEHDFGIHEVKDLITKLADTE